MDNETLRKLQLTELDILKDVVAILNKYNLNYYLYGGTLLGAIRHKAFIPWDDDIDIAMPRDDYEKFLEICDQELPNYEIQSPYKTKNYFLPFAKVRKKNTLFLEQQSANIDIFKGIFIDIFPIDNVEENDFSLKLRALKIRIITDTINYKTKRSKTIFYSKYWYAVFLFQIFSVKTLLLRQQKIMKKCKNNKSKYLISFGSSFGYRRELVLREWCEPTIEAVFEGERFKIPNNYDAYLTVNYGDWRKLPPENERVTHNPIKIDFDTTKE